MSRLQLASTLHRQVAAHPSSSDVSTASSTDAVTKAPSFAETLSLRERKSAINPVPFLQNVTAAKRSTMVQFQALNRLETVAAQAASGDKNAAETLAALIPIATLFQSVAARISSPEVTSKPASTPGEQASASAAASVPATEPKDEGKKALTKTDKVVNFGDRFDKILKPFEWSLKILSAVAAVTTIEHNLGS
jgi:hypothetical protein